MKIDLTEKFFDTWQVLKWLGTLKIIGILEIIIGIVTLVSLIISSAAAPPRPLNIFTFIALTGTISMLLGIGLWRFNRVAYDLLLYFSSVIILSKFLILADIIRLNNGLDVMIPSPVKSWISILYHAFVIYYLSLAEVRSQFEE